MKKAEQIISEISDAEKVKRYRELEVIINNNSTIKTKLDELKKIQKEIVHAENLNKPKILKRLKEKYEELYNNFLELPLIAEYLDLQVELNNFLQSFTNIIEDGIKNDLES